MWAQRGNCAIYVKLGHKRKKSELAVNKDLFVMMGVSHIQADISCASKLISYQEWPMSITSRNVPPDP